jgi:hypothetical protein
MPPNGLQPLRKVFNRSPNAESNKHNGIESSKIERPKMAEHIEDLQQRFAELKKRVELVRSYL